MDYKVSKNFDMNITFEELINYNKTCKVEYGNVRNFESYNGLLIYVSHPQDREEFSIELGVCEDGITYEGDYGCQDSFKEIPIDEGLKLLEIYRQFINSKIEFNNLLSENDI